MRILIRKQGHKWMPVKQVDVRAESEIQKLLAEAPYLIPVEDMRQDASSLVVAVPELTLPNGTSIDILAFSPDGDIAVIECKLETNAESRRQVVGQILEYAASLWGMTYEDLSHRIEQRIGKPLDVLVEEAVAGEWDNESFKKGIIASLETGSFLLIIVVDKINDTLRSIIHYLNATSRPAFGIYALEMQQFQFEDVEILVPHLHGQALRDQRAATRPRRRWTPEQFFQIMQQSVPPEILQIAKDLYHWAEETADRVWMGSGTQKGSFTFHYLRDNKTISVFTVYSDGKLQINYGWMSNRVPETVLREFHNRLRTLQGFRHLPEDFSKYPNVDLRTLKSPHDLAAFKQAVEWLGTQV